MLSGTYSFFRWLSHGFLFYWCEIVSKSGGAEFELGKREKNGENRKQILLSPFSAVGRDR